MHYFLQQVPNYKGAIPIEEVRAETLVDALFYRDFVDCMKPCLVKNAIEHWPAYRLWDSSEYILNVVGNKDVMVAKEPLVEYQNAANRNVALKERINRAFFKTRLREFFTDVTSTDGGYRALHSYPLKKYSVLERLGKDVLGFSFIKSPPVPKSYPMHRIFIYRRSYSDWHFHPVDETLMCQVKGFKEVLLIEPGGESFAALLEIGQSIGYVYDVDIARFPKYEIIHPYRALVCPGDALYIPPFWFHAVEALDNDWGITVASCWGSPSQVHRDRDCARYRDDMRRLLREL